MNFIKIKTKVIEIPDEIFMSYLRYRKSPKYDLEIFGNKNEDFIKVVNFFETSPKFIKTNQPTEVALEKLEELRKYYLED